MSTHMNGTCSDCNRPIHLVKASAPQGKARCQPCRRARPTRTVTTEECTACSALFERSLKSIRRTCGAPICAARWRAAVVFGVDVDLVPSTVGELAAFRRAQERLRCARRRSRVALQGSEDVDPLRVFERDGWRCRLCGRRVGRSLPGRDRMGPTLDHVVPLSQGGEHSYANTALAHRSCNSVKGARVVSGGEQLRLIG